MLWLSLNSLMLLLFDIQMKRTVLVLHQTVVGSGTVTKLKTWPGGLKIKQKKLWSATVSIFLFLLEGCGLGGGPLKGVEDAQTGKEHSVQAARPNYMLRGLQGLFSV